MFQTKVVQKVKILILFSMYIFLNRAGHDIMWQNGVEPDTTDNTVRRMRMTYCITYGYRHTLRIC